MNRHHPLPALLVLLAASALAGCVAPQSEVNVLQTRINQQEQTIKQLNSQLAGVQPAQADTWAQVQSLRQEMATLRGQIDNLNHATSATGGVAGLADHVSRHDAALRMLEAHLALNLNLDTPAVPGMASPGPQAVAPLPPVPSAPSVPAQTPPTGDTVAKTLYDSGYQAFTQRQYQQSLNAFTDFTRTYPDHPLIGNAWFWKAENNFQLQNYANAALDYEQVITKYPDNSKASAAYLKQAMSFEKVNKKDVARYRLDELIKKFPSSSEATRAKKLLADMK
jgi:tol-pal system protein YbgF